MDLPPAPTPPVNSGGAGGGGGGMPSNSDRTANLLNLLKFSGSGSSATQQLHRNQSQQYQQYQAQQQQHQEPQQQQQPPQHLEQYQAPADPEQQFRHQASNQFPDQRHNPVVEHQQPGLPSFQLPATIHQPAPAGGDPSGLLAALMRGAQEAEEAKQSPPAQAPNAFGNGPPGADTTSYLLNLLNRPKPSQTEQPQLPDPPRNNRSSQSPEEAPDPSRYSNSNRYSQYGQSSNAYLAAQQYMQQHQQHRQPDSFAETQYQSPPADSFSHPPTQESPEVSALYQQLMGSLGQSSPQSSSAQAPSAAPSFHILKKDQGSPAGSQHADQSRAGSQHSPVASPHDLARRTIDRSSSLQSHHSTHRSSKHTPPTSDGYASVDRNKETVSEAISDIAGQADRDARQALERAEHGQVKPSGSDDRELRATALAAEREIEEIERSLENDPQYDSTEQGLLEDIRKSVHDIIDDTQGVADSWESADQEEIVVEEEKETPPVKVFNFPMKPWISITLKDDAAVGDRPEFREESIMDIGRLKKEFDQMDRNLYTASQTYMTYGMSKQGGLRVIRQDDGKDTKVFADTKDRIFNLGMSVTPSDYEGVHKEAIIGTGVSGTVYWVQIKDGEKDHIDDTHLEQYGFALPPISSQEGDAPGGVLKTRARASTAHPEFFAVGRGKSINLIWPSYILQNKLFKPGHDRFVDTESLLKQSSLKINTGKAGKDFTFSQDDTVVVSLDKSGRVKFWDVRDLTAAKEGSDPRNPTPAQSSLEVKEPLLTLASTPEGEKAWPTSVLLLDKQRPYQKRCALRYLIVGMKQNHTLQLWDLALGKPVQEFNLPHEKESDAVCSVMYHPATGMIVIGHPTRNSIYFAHLSAPKYNLKSVSQAEYIQRLVAQDTSIPQPDSTAVISGVREYSFANRGILRSLDILCDPAMTQDSDEPTLFELYAMHSKGVACLLIKQSELGWSKDNKVIDGVDAVAEGLVTVSKLKTPQPAEPSTELSQARTIHRGPSASKEPLPIIAVQSEVAQRALEAATPVKVKTESKESETPAPSSKENQVEKPERKSRKKKAAAQTEATTNGNTASPRVAQTNKSDLPKGTANLGANGISTEAFDSAIATMESRLSSSLADSLKSSLKNLQGKIDDGARVRDETFNQHQLKLLDMVSEVLNDNTQKVLEALVHDQFTNLVIPAIGDKASKAVTDLLNSKLQPHIGSVVQKEIQSALPQALSRSLRSSEFVNAISDRVGTSVASTVQQEVLATLTQRLTPTFTNIATQSAQRVASEVHEQYHNQLDRLKAQHVADSKKIDQLLTYVSRLTDMVSTMASSQSSLQAEFLKFKAQPVHELPGMGGPQGGQHNMGPQGYPSSIAPGSTLANNSGYDNYPPSQAPSHPQQFVGSPQYLRSHQHVASPHGSAPGSEHLGPVSSVGTASGVYANQLAKNESEMDQDLLQRIRGIEQNIQEGRLQEAMIQWIQSGREGEIFRRCLSRYPPGKFEELPPLMLLVVIATLSKDLKPNQRLKEEIEWIEMAVRAFRDHMPGYDWDQQGFREVVQSTSQTMQLLISRISPLIAGISDGFPTDPFLANLERGKLEWIVKTSGHILETFSAPQRYE